MKRLLLSLLVTIAVIATTQSAYAQVTVTNLRTEYKVDPVGIDVAVPRLSWQHTTSLRGYVQSAYQVRVAETIKGLKKALWDSGRTTSDASIHVPYGGPALSSGRRYYWQVRTWDGGGKASSWSTPAFFETGFLDASDWKARWIGPAQPGDPARMQPGPLLRSTFQVSGPVASARAYVSALGLYEMEINGHRVGDQVLTPGWTSYDTRVQYQTYDITDLLQRGNNAVGAMLGDGWYRGNLAWSGNRNVYGKDHAFIAQIEITYRNGRREIIVTDDSWRTSTGPVTMSDIYEGETYDARLEKTGWSRPEYDASRWSTARIIDHPTSVLIAPAGPPVRRVEEIKPVRVIRTPEGDTVYDMGQNMVGWIRLKVRGESGDTITLRHTEVLDKAGNFYTANLRSADQTVRYVLKGGNEEEYEPHFTFQGFRYVAVDGLRGDASTDALTGVVVHSDFTPTGTFTTSNPMLNQLQHNIVWGQKGNFVDVPTDCPQRDERLGWTGDAQAFARTAAFNADVASFFTKWLGDLRADQREDGSVPDVIPSVFDRQNPTGNGSSGWADVATIVPWTMYLTYGDVRLLETQYPSMKAWVDYIRKAAGDAYIWNTGWHFGDWLAYATTRSDYPGATTDKDLIATAFFAHSTDLLQKAATVLGKTDDARFYAAEAAKVRQAFQREFVTGTGRLASNTQTAYVLALWFDLLPESMRAGAAERLAANVRSFENHLTTGFLGTPYLCHALSANGQANVAYDLLNQQTYPSWLYPVKMGATTIWERWDGIKPDGSFQDAGMNSFNHYAYGAIGDWMYSVVAGLDLDPARPAYKHVLVQPRPGGGLTHAEATLQTMYGEAGSAWKVDNGVFTLTATIPPNTSATIRLPGVTLEQVRESGSLLDAAVGLTAPRQDGTDVVVEAGSGRYVFTWQVP